MPAGRRHDRLANRILLVCAVVTLVAVTAGAWFRSQEVPVDPVTLCPADRPSAGVTLLLVDKTDPMSGDQVDALKREIRVISRQLGVHERLSIFLIDADVERVLHPVFSRCSPGSREQANPLVQNPRRIGERFEAEFGSPLAEALDALTEPATHPVSPILEAIRAAVEAPDFRDADAPRRLVIVSDMLHNMPPLSLYAGAPSLEELRTSPYYRSLRSDLRDAEVRLVVLFRRGQPEQQREGFEPFWRGVLADANAAQVEIEWR